MSYKTIEESFWTDRDVKALSVTDKLLLLYLVTNPHAHYSGIYYLPPSFIAEETGLPVKTILQGLANLTPKFALYDDEFLVVWVCKMCKYQSRQGGNPVQLKKGIEKHLENIHSVTLILDFNQEYRRLSLTLPERCMKVEGTLKQPSGTAPVSVTALGSDSVERGVGETEKHKYGEYAHVLLADFEYSKLFERYGADGAAKWIKTLDEGIEQKGYKYKNHYLTILKWEEKDRKGDSHGAHGIGGRAATQGIQGAPGKYAGISETINLDGEA